jgi:hypothetical protein
MKTVEGFCEVDRLAKHVEKFCKVVFERIKRLPQLSSDLKYHLMEIKDVRIQIRKIYLDELSFRLEQSKAPLEKLERTVSEILS